MKRIAIALLIAGAVFVLSYREKGKHAQPSPEIPGPQDPTPKRIVTLAPSITEVLFAVGLGDSVVGVARRSEYPPEAASKPTVGGYFDPNYEAIAALEPDLIVMLQEHTEARRRLGDLGFTTLQVRHNTIDEIVDSIRTVGRTAHVEAKASELVDGIRRQLDEITQKVHGRKRPSVLIAVGRDVRLGAPERICIAGKGGLYGQMLQRAGGINAFKGDVPFPNVSREGILRMDPDVVIDAIGDMVEHDLDHQAIVNQWSVLPQLKAVKNNRVYVFDQNAAIIPGPRFVQTVRQMARVLHPDAEKE